MPKATPAVLAFNAGEWSPAISARVDLPKRAQSVRYSRNALPTIEGSAKKRCGTKYIDDAIGNLGQALVPWVRSKDDAYVLCFADDIFSVFDETGDYSIKHQNEYDIEQDTWSGTTTGTASVTGTLITDKVYNVAGSITSGTWTYKTTLTGLDPTLNYTLSVDVRRQVSAATVQIVMNGLGIAAYDLAAANAAWATFDHDSQEKPDASGNLEVYFYATGTGSDLLDFRNLRVYRDVATSRSESPYSADEAKALQWGQSFDVQYLASESVRPHTMSRLADDDWRLDYIHFQATPILPENADTNNTLTLSSGTMTAVAPTFDADMVGGQIAVRSVIESEYKKWAAGLSVTTGDFLYYDSSERTGYINAYRASTAGTTGGKPPTHDSGSLSDGAVTWEFAHSRYTYYRIVSYTSDTVVEVVPIDAGYTPSILTTGAFRWSEGAWSNYRGWPKCVTFYEDRLIFGNTDTQPYTIWGSEADNYLSFNPGYSLDTDAFNYTINEARNEISFLNNHRVLEIGTEGAVFVARGGGDGDSITPTNILITRERGVGAERQQPASVDGSTVYVQRGRKNVREFRYGTLEENDLGFEVSATSRHITGLGTNRLEYQSTPEQRIWTYTDDGQLVTSLFSRSMEVIAWNRHDVSGDVIATCVIPSEDGDTDTVWMIVERVINGFLVRYIEILTDDSGVYLDSHVTKTYGTPETDIDDLDYLFGATVHVVADGGYVGTKEVGLYDVSKVGFKLDEPASTVIVGFYKSMIVDPQDVEAGSSNGVSLTKKKKVNDVGVVLVKTGPGAEVGMQPAVVGSESTDSDMSPIDMRNTEDAMDTSVPLFSGNKVVSLLSSWSDEELPGGAIRFEHTTPLPCELLALVLQIDTQDAR